VIQLLRDLRDDDSIKAIVLEIDSGGGSATGSEQIYSELLKINQDKLTYAYFQNVAASGGYYIASACNKIYSSPYSVTGSIGAVMVRPNLKGLYEKLGIKKDRIGFYPMREIFSEYGEPTKEGKNFLTSEIKRVTSRFYEVVMKNRNIDLKELEPKAGGRIFSGIDFLKMKMVDSNSSFLEMLSDIKTELKLIDPEIVYMIPEYSFKAFVREFRLTMNLVQNPKKILFPKQNKENILFESELANLLIENKF